MRILNIYTAGAMSCYGEKAEFPKQWRKQVSDWIEDNTSCFVCVNPTDYYEYGTDYHKSEREIMSFDLRKVREADILLVNLKDLDNSIGTCDEIFYAWTRKTPIIGFIEDEDTCENIHPWKIEQIDRIETGEGAMFKALEYIKNYYS